MVLIQVCGCTKLAEAIGTQFENAFDGLGSAFVYHKASALIFTYNRQPDRTLCGNRSAHRPGFLQRSTSGCQRALTPRLRLVIGPRENDDGYDQCGEIVVDS